MKNEIKCRIFFLAAQALIFAAEITYFKDCFSVSKLLYFILAFSLLPMVIIFINPHSKFSKTVCGFAIAVAVIFGAVYGIYLRRPIGFVVALLTSRFGFIFYLSRRTETQRTFVDENFGYGCFGCNRSQCRLSFKQTFSYREFYYPKRKCGYVG